LGLCFSRDLFFEIHLKKIRGDFFGFLTLLISSDIYLTNGGYSDFTHVPGAPPHRFSSPGGDIPGFSESPIYSVFLQMNPIQRISYRGRGREGVKPPPVYAVPLHFFYILKGYQQSRIFKR
jgi:hypothetical protein